MYDVAQPRLALLTITPVKPNPTPISANMKVCKTDVKSATASLKIWPALTACTTIQSKSVVEYTLRMLGRAHTCSSSTETMSRRSCGVHAQAMSCFGRTGELHLDLYVHWQDCFSWFFDDAVASATRSMFCNILTQTD